MQALSTLIIMKKKKKRDKFKFDWNHMWGIPCSDDNTMVKIELFYIKTIKLLWYVTSFNKVITIIIIF